MDFGSIAGQREVVGSLSRSVATGKIGHAYIFCGPEGIGKKSVARLFAGILLCTGRDNRSETAIASCGACQPCNLFEAASNPDFYRIETAEASIGVDEIRDLQADMAIRPFCSKRKVYLIANADKMTVQAQNCLLKTLEEPPAFAVIILTASCEDALLDTIRSRAVRYNFRKNTPDEVEVFLKSRFGNNISGMDFIISYADGIIGKAVDIAGDEEFIALREDTVKIIESIENAKLADVFSLHDFFNNNKNRIDTVLDMMTSFYRDMLVFLKTGHENLLINSDKKDIILNIAGDLSAEKLVKNIENIGLTQLGLRKNVNFQLSIEVMLMKLMEDQ